MSVEIICDPGSTHMGKKAYALELIQIAADAGCNVIKFQLFPDLPLYLDKGNIPVPYGWFDELLIAGKRCGIQVTASVFDEDAIELVAKKQVPYIKFAYARQHWLDKIQGLLNIGRKVMVSTDCEKDHLLPKHNNLIKLYCVAEYPVKSLLDFESLFFERFDGFSDHTLGWKQAVRAVKAGAKIIEKHIKLPYEDCDCPDSRFALSPEDLVHFVEVVRGAE